MPRIKTNTITEFIASIKLFVIKTTSSNISAPIQITETE